MDVAVFCDFIDHLTSILSVAWRPTLQNMMLPRSWILRLLERPAHLSKKSFNSGLIRDLLHYIPRLFEAIYDPAMTSHPGK